MCGFAGKFYFSPGEKPDQELVKKMTGLLIHRGPDAEGFFFEGQAGFGHRRLKVIDLETGSQPMSSACGRGVIVYNGEVYNFRELRSELEGKGCKFKTSSDTEVVLNACLEWGEDCLARLRGVFAFAVFDREQNSLLLARDHFGVKPLYYYEGPGWLSFASELKALLADPEIAHKIDPVALYQFFSVQHIPAPLSGVAGVKKLLSAHCLLARNGQAAVRRFWKLSPRDEFSAPGREPAQERIFAELERAVGDELVSEVPLGIFLSGGLDSSTVTAAALKQSSGKVKAYTVGFEEAQWDETKWAGAVARELHAEHIVLASRAQDLAALLEKIVWHFDEPNGNYSAVANYLLCQACQKEITVALSGGGGDEVFAGYTHHLADKLVDYYCRLTPALARKALLAPIFAALSKEQDQAPGFRRRLSRALGFEEPDLALRHLRFLTIGNFRPWMEKGEFIGFDKISAREREGNDPYRHLARWAYEYPGRDKFNSLLWLDLNSYLCDDILLMTDRMSMANALEVRVPLLDYKLVELLFNLPFSYKLQGLDKKIILKNYLLKKLPRELVYRPKQGFGVPLQVWIKGRLKAFFLELFQGELARKEDFISMPVARQLLQEHIEQGRDHTQRIWMAAHYLLWKKSFALN